MNDINKDDLMEIESLVFKRLTKHLQDNPEVQNIELMNFNDDKKYLEELIKKNFDLTKNRLIVIIPLLPWQKVINIPQNNEIEYLFIKLKKKHYFTIDDHPNAIGHKEIAKKIYDYLNENQN